MKIKIILVFCMLAFGFNSIAQQKKANTLLNIDIKKDSITNFKTPQKSVTQGSVIVEGNRINYQADAGTIILKNEMKKPTISMSYVAYFRSGENDLSARPVTFIYNGGPGSSTIWLHMGAWGPRRVNLTDTIRTRAPYKTVNNDYSLLDASDLVFIDAPGTGFGQIITKDEGGAGEPKEFFGIDPDARAFAEFITHFLSQYNRWDSPKYLFGESYGTFRSAIVSNILETEDGVGLNGVILLSQLLSYGNMTDLAAANPGMDLPFELALPSCAATAWYHHKLPNQPEKLEPFLKEVEDFAMNEYATALGKGALLDSVSFNKIAEKLHSYIGLPVEYIRKANLRISGPKFEQTLLGTEEQVTGRLDSRFTGFAIDPQSEVSQYDPMDSYIDAAFVATFNNYIRTELKFGAGMKYKPIDFSLIRQWDFRHQPPGFPFKFYPNVMPDLATVMKYNPNLKLMLNMGYFDLGTPYFEGIYEMNHLPIPAALQKNIEYDHYYSGHMVYLHPESLKELHDNVARFIQSTH